jgi:hypothetical protein
MVVIAARGKLRFTWLNSCQPFHLTEGNIPRFQKRRQLRRLSLQRRTLVRLMQPQLDRLKRRPLQV